MNLNLLKNVYNDSPLYIKKIYSRIPVNIRNGGDYRKWLKFLKSSSIDISMFQFEKLKETLILAYENTLYYRELFNEIHFNPYKFYDIDEYNRIPLLSKEIVKNNFDKLLIQPFNKSKSFFVTTGGTSGEQAKFWQSNNIWKKEMAYVHYYWGKHGYTPKHLKASFRGGDFSELPVGIYWKNNPIQNEIHFSPFNLNRNTVNAYIKKLNELKPLFFHGYPSSILSLIDNMNVIEKTLDYKVECIFLVSENYTKEQINKIKSFFQCKVFSFYGHSERLIFAPTINDDLSLYQIDPLYGYFELISNKNIIKSNNIIGEIIGTSFDNFSMPLIRYKTGDITSYNDFDNNIINQIEGEGRRWDQEYIEGLNSENISLTALNMHSDIFKNVLNYQFYQEETGKLILRMIVNNSFTEKDNDIILESFNKKIGNVIQFSTKIMDNLELTERGKFKLLIKK